MTELSLRCASIYALEYQRDLSGMWKWEAVTGIASERSFFVGTSSTYCDWWWVPGDTEEKLQNLRIGREGGAAASDAREFHCHVFPEQWKSVHLLEQLIQLAPKIHSWSPDRCAVHCCPHTQRTNYLSSVLNTVFMLQSLGNCSMSWCCDAEHRTDNRPSTEQHNTPTLKQMGRSGGDGYIRKVSVWKSAALMRNTWNSWLEGEERQLRQKKKKNLSTSNLNKSFSWKKSFDMWKR